jgi:SAM-dependent methyltransferase
MWARLARPALRVKVRLRALYAGVVRRLQRSWLSRVRRRLRHGRVDAQPGHEVDVELDRLSDFLDWWRENPWISDPGVIRSIVEHALEHGIQSSFLGRVPPEEVDLRGEDYREALLARELNCRLRAVLDQIHDLTGRVPPSELRIYASEAVTHFAEQLRSRYPRFYGSEFLPTPELREKYDSIPHEDLHSLSLPDATLDVAVANEVFEHVPDLDRVLGELARVLRPGGELIATFPMNYGEEKTLVRAVLEDGAIRHLAEPEFHGDPIDVQNRSLVFQIPGWDILERARKAGFTQARMHFVSSRVRGITATEIAGILLLRAQR